MTNISKPIRLSMMDIVRLGLLGVRIRKFTVVGVLAPVPLAGDIDRAVLVGGPAARTWLGFDGHPTVVYVKAVENAIEDVRSPRCIRSYPAWCR